MWFKLERGSLDGLIPECSAAAILLASCFKKANKHLFHERKLEEPIYITKEVVLNRNINGFKKVSRKAVTELGDLTIASLYADETPVTAVAEDL